VLGAYEIQPARVMRRQLIHAEEQDHGDRRNQSPSRPKSAGNATNANHSSDFWHPDKYSGSLSIRDSQPPHLFINFHRRIVAQKDNQANKVDSVKSLNPDHISPPNHYLALSGQLTKMFGQSAMPGFSWSFARGLSATVPIDIKIRAGNKKVLNIA
jgi:hypothetical protein